MKYRAVLLDADDTVADFHAAEEKALKILFDRLGFTMEEAADDYKRINKACWAAYEKGEMTQPELRKARFDGFLKLHPSDMSACDAALFYETALSRQTDLLPGALEAVKAISEKMPIAIVTNGIASIQRPRMEKSPLRPYISEVVISEEVGASKPRPEMLYAALERLGGLSAKDVLMIGDSLTSDMGAAKNAGIDFLWYNPKGKARPQDAHITYETDNISDFAVYALQEE